jgi:hypothetical protein
MTTTKPFDPWAQCAKCKDVHRESERDMKKCTLCKGVWWSCCAKCGSSAKTPLAMVPKQREMFDQPGINQSAYACTIATRSVMKSARL